MPTLVEPPKTGRARTIETATCLSRFPEIEEAGMPQWPRTVRGKLYLLLFVGVSLWFLVQGLVALSGAVVWVLLATISIVALTAVAIYVWRRRADAALELVTVDGPSFGDVLRRRNASEASEL